MAGTCPCGSGDFLWKRTKLFCSFEISMVYFTYCKVYTQIIDIQKYPTFSNKDGNMVCVDRYRKEDHQRNFFRRRNTRRPGHWPRENEQINEFTIQHHARLSLFFRQDYGPWLTQVPHWIQLDLEMAAIIFWAQTSYIPWPHWPCLQVLCLIPLAYMTYTAYFSCLAFRGARGP